jgi:hypothetical protein
VNGTLPANGTVCPVDAPIFKPNNQPPPARDERLSLKDQKLVAALRSLSLNNAIARHRVGRIL